MRSDSRNGLVATALVSAAISITPVGTVHAQTDIRFMAGFSWSWGVEHTRICIVDTCANSAIWTHERLTPTAGLVVLAQFARPLWLEAGAVIAPKGWGLPTRPTGEVTYLELPVLVHVGYRRSAPGIGVSAVLGVAPDVDLLHWARNDAAMVGGMEIEIMTLAGWRYSMGARYARGLRSFDGFGNRAFTVLFGVSPYGRGPR